MPAPDQESHRSHNADDGHEHRRNDQRNTLEEEQQQEKDGQPGKGGRGRHLHQHLHPERVFGHRQTGNVDLLFAIPIRCERLNQGGRVVAEGLLLDRDVKSDRLAVFGNEGSLVERIAHGIVANGQRLLARGGRALHQILEFE